MMHPKNMDALGRVAVHDTATDEILHRPAGVAQEILERNPDGRFKVLTKDDKDAPLASPRDAHPGKRRAVLAKEKAARDSEDAAFVTGDATKLQVADGHLAPAAQPEADATIGIAEQDGDPKKKRRVAKQEAQAAEQDREEAEAEDE